MKNHNFPKFANFLQYKSKLYRLCLITLIPALFLSACFSPWSGEEEMAAVVISLAAPNTSRILLDLSPGNEEYLNFTYKLWLGSKGPYDLATGSSNPLNLTGTVPVGTYSKIRIKAYQDFAEFDTAYTPPGVPANSAHPFTGPDKILRAYGEENLQSPVSIGTGTNTLIPVSLYSAMEVTSWAELSWAVSNPKGAAFPTAGRTEYIFVKDSFNAGNTNPIPIDRNIILTAERNVTISRDTLLYSFFNVYGTGELTLEPGTGGSLTFDGGGSGSSVISVGASGGTVNMHDGVKITNNGSSSASGGGVSMTGGAFDMWGGEISGNTAGQGGGVYITGGGTFAMWGGTIGVSGNPNTSANGGGVFVDNGTFNLNGGTITSNTASADGGGVFVTVNGTFSTSGADFDNVISNNIAGGSGGGVHSAGSFNMGWRTTISGNTASVNGGGVYISGGGSSFSKDQNAVISSNVAPATKGKSIYVGINPVPDSVYNDDPDIPIAVLVQINTNGTGFTNINPPQSDPFWN
jgi:hypothetical protein